MFEGKNVRGVSGGTTLILRWKVQICLLKEYIRLNLIYSTTSPLRVYCEFYLVYFTFPFRPDFPRLLTLLSLFSHFISYLLRIDVWSTQDDWVLLLLIRTPLLHRPTPVFYPQTHFRKESSFYSPQILFKSEARSYYLMLIFLFQMKSLWVFFQGHKTLVSLRVIDLYSWIPEPEGVLKENSTCYGVRDLKSSDTNVHWDSLENLYKQLRVVLFRCLCRVIHFSYS